MNRRDPYEAWKDARRAVDARPAFTEQVMAKVREADAVRRETASMRRALVAASVLVAAFAIAFVRLAGQAALIAWVSERGF
jgi:hypothetical protein